MFWASLAGARADENASLITNRNRWVEYARELEGRVNSLERDLGQLQDVLKEWQDEAVEANAYNDVHRAAYKKATGRSLLETIGEQEMKQRVAASTEIVKKNLFQG